MLLEVELVKSDKLTPISSWDDENIFDLLKSTDNLSDTFDITIRFAKYSFSAFSYSISDTVIDLLVNQRLFVKRQNYTFFISETPLFIVKFGIKDAIISFFSRDNMEVNLDIKVHDVDAELNRQANIGLRLVDTIGGQTAVNSLFARVHDDLASTNRSSFIHESVVTP